MADALGRTVLHRDRYARCWGLGDRKAPSAITPALVLMDEDPILPLSYAPFQSSTTSTLPSTLSVRSTVRMGGQVSMFEFVNLGSSRLTRLDFVRCMVRGPNPNPNPNSTFTLSSSIQ